MEHAVPPTRFRRLFTALGVLSVGLAVLGAILPIMPTTIFLIAAAYCFARGSPALGRRLLGAKIFRPYMGYVYGERRMSTRARVVLILWIWGSVALSLTLIARKGALATWIVIVAAAFAILSSLSVILSGRGGSKARPR